MTQIQNDLAVVGSAPSIGSILAAAVDKGLDTNALEKLFQLYERDQDRKAKQAFSEAMATFKATCPPVKRRAINSQFTVVDPRSGCKVPRRYASLEDIEATIRGPMGKCGLSYRWADTAVDNGVLTMRCVISHADGHSESSAVVLPVDSKAGCSDQQKFGAAMTYAQRYSLIQALGLTSCDEDTDANAEPPKTITDEQVLEIEALIETTGADKERFLGFVGFERISDITVDQFARAVAALKSKAKKNGAAK